MGRKSKKPQEEASVFLETPVHQNGRRTDSHTSPHILVFIIILTVGGFLIGWFGVQMQQSLDQLLESFTTTEQRIINFQQVIEMTAEQPDTDLLDEERFLALEEVWKQAQKKAEVTLETSEKLRNSDVLSQLWTLQAGMDSQWDEMKQVTLSVTSLRSTFKNQSEEFKVMKENIVASLSSNSALSENMAGITQALVSLHSRVVQYIASVQALNAQLERPASELNELKDVINLHNVVLNTHHQEMAALKELIKAKKTMRAQSLEETLKSVQLTLDEQLLTSQILHSSVMARLQTFHSQLINQPSWPIIHKSKYQDCTSEETWLEEKLKDVQQKFGQVVDNMAEDQEVEEAIEVEQLLDGDDIEEEEIQQEKQVQEKRGRQGEEEGDGGKASWEEVADETTTGHVLI